MRIIKKIKSYILYDRNAFFLSTEVIWAAVLIAAQSFFSPYAVRLGATSFEIGLLTSIPALLTFLLSIPVGWFLKQRKNSLKWALGGMTVTRLGYLFLAIVPFIQESSISKGSLIVIAMIALTVPDLFYKIGQWPFIMKLIPPDKRIRVFTNRSLLTLSVTGIGVYIFGKWLDRVAYPNSFQWMVVFAVAISLLSLLFWLKVKLPENNTGSLLTDKRKSKGHRINVGFLQYLNLRTDYGKVVINQILAYIGLWTATPLYVLYIVKNLHATDEWIGLQVTVNSIAAIVGWLAARKLCFKWGEDRVLKWSSQFVSLYPFLMSFAFSMRPLLFISALNSIVTPIFSLSHNNCLLRAIPAENEHDGISFYNSIFSLGNFICPILGVMLADKLGITAVLLGCGVISFIGSLSFHIWPYSINMKDSCSKLQENALP